MLCRQARDDTEPAGLATSPYAQQEEQSLCQRLRGLPAGRKRLVDSTIGEAGHGDEHRGAKATMPTGWRHADMWAPFGRSESLHGVWAFCALAGMVSLRPESTRQ
jgi:hypothetical protein